ncbi:hypothetical protein ACOSQ4_028510 [Xanthoceras sorbifolium]
MVRARSQSDMERLMERCSKKMAFFLSEGADWWLELTNRVEAGEGGVGELVIDGNEKVKGLCEDTIEEGLRG